MSKNYLSKLVMPVTVDGNVVSTTFDIKDAEARELITALGDALYWIGVTTTELVDNVTSSPDITVNGQSVTAKVGGMAQYSAEEFVWNGSAWQSVGKNNFGNLAFKNSASGDVVAAGTIENGTITVTPGTSAVLPFGSAGQLPEWTYNGTTETATFSAGQLASAGTSVDVVTSIASVSQGTSTFTGTSVSVTVS